MSRLIADFLRALTPPVWETPEEYTGLEYRWKIIVFRPAYFTKEIFLLLGIVLYTAFIILGRAHNSRKTKKWFDAHLPLYAAQFSKPTNNGLTQDGDTDYFNFSTGRRGVASLHTIFKLRPRHDFFQFAFQFARTFVDLQYRPVDEIVLDFKLAANAPVSEFVFAIVNKDELQTVKDGRWDLTFTKIGQHASLPDMMSVMSEFADVTDSLLKPSALVNILNDPAILPYFRSLSITDQPRERPTAGPLLPAEREKHVILSLIAPPASQAAVTLPLITALFTLIDNLPKLGLRPETRNKLKKARDELDKDLKTEFDAPGKESAKEEAENKKVAKRKAEQERLAKLSAAEQKKAADKERKRATRKQQSKMSVRK